MSWPVVPLGDVAETSLGKMLDKGKFKGLNHVPYLRNVNVQWGRISTDDVMTMELADDERERFGVRPGDLLVCEGGEIGRCAIWAGGADYIAYQKALHRIRPGKDLDACYLRYLLEHHSDSGTLARLSTGSTIAHLPQQQLRRVPVPLPPIDEQRRIVDLLEDHLYRLDQAAASLSSARARTQVLGSQVLLDALNAVQTENVELSRTLIQPLANGRSVQTLAGGFPVLRLTALQDGRIDLAQRKEGAWDRAAAERFLVEKGDFLIARGNGSLRLVGIGGLVIEDPDPIAYPDTLIRARPDPTLLAPEFLALVWNSQIVRRQIEVCARTTAGIYKVNQKDLGSVLVPLPSLSDQADVVARAQGLRESVGRLSAAEDLAMRRLESLRRSLLAAAFSGRLTSDMHRQQMDLVNP